MTKFIKAYIVGYDESDDTYKFSAWGHEEEHKVVDAGYCLDAPDFDDFCVPGLFVSALIGEYGEPEELIGKVASLPLP